MTYVTYLKFVLVCFLCFHQRCHPVNEQLAHTRRRGVSVRSKERVIPPSLYIRPFCVPLERSQEARENAETGACIIFRFPNYVLNIIFEIKLSNFVFTKLYFSNSMFVFQFLKSRSKQLLLSSIFLDLPPVLCP